MDSATISSNPACSERWPPGRRQIDGHAFKAGDGLSLDVDVVVAFTDVLPQIGSVILVDDGAAAAGHEQILTALIHHVTSGGLWSLGRPPCVRKVVRSV